MKTLAKLFAAVAMIAFLGACASRSTVEQAAQNAQGDQTRAESAATTAQTAANDAEASAKKAQDGAAAADDAVRRAKDAVARLEAYFAESVTK